MLAVLFMSLFSSLLQSSSSENQMSSTPSDIHPQYRPSMYNYIYMLFMAELVTAIYI